MGFFVPLDDTRTKVGRLNARQTGMRTTLFVVPATGVLQDEWDTFDPHGDYVTTHTTQELAGKQRSGVTVLNRFSNHPWSPAQDKSAKPRKTRTRRGGRKTHLANA